MGRFDRLTGRNVNRGGDWSANSHQTLEEAKQRFSLRSSRGSVAWRHLHFPCLFSSMARGYGPVVLSQQETKYTGMDQRFLGLPGCRLHRLTTVCNC